MINSLVFNCRINNLYACASGNPPNPDTDGIPNDMYYFKQAMNKAVNKQLDNFAKWLAKHSTCKVVAPTAPLVEYGPVANGISWSTIDGSNLMQFNPDGSSCELQGTSKSKGGDKDYPNIIQP
jgi:hypothetical protein